jgi:hypothetical protein
MVRSCFMGCTQVILVTGFFLAVGGCGRGLFTSSGFRTTGEDGGAEGDTSIDVPANGDRPLVPDRQVPSDEPGSPDRQSPPDQPVRSDAPDAQATLDALVPGASTTQQVDYDGKLVTLGDAALDVPKGAFPSGAPNAVTLTLESTDGSLPGYAGAIGPIYSITKATAQWNAVTLRIRFTPSPSIPLNRVALAYQDTLARIWIYIPRSSYDTATGTVSGTVTDFSGTRLFAPVESCDETLEAGTACPGTLKCQGGACQ